MHRPRLLVGLAAAFALMTAALAAAGILYNLAILAPAVLFGAVTYILWAHATGRLAARIYRGVERRAAPNGDRFATCRAGSRSKRRDRGRSSDVGGTRWGGSGRRQDTTTAKGSRTAGGPRAGSRATPTRSHARAVLGVDADADQATIRAAYRERVKDVHPDATEGDTDRFKQIKDAYETLRE